MTDYANISSRAMLASLHISVWSAQKFDRGVSDEVTTAKGAADGSARVNKHLFGTRRKARAVAPLFAAVLDAAETLRTVHDRETLPWSNQAGERLLPTTNFVVYTDAMRRAGAAFARAADDFVAAYPTMHAAAQAKLGELFRAEDFPAPSVIRRLYRYAIDLDPLPAGTGDVRVDLPAETVARIEADVTARLEARTRDAMADAWTRLRAAVERVQRAASTSESGRKSPVHDTLMDHLRDTVDVLGRLNVAESAELDEILARVLRELSTIAPEDLRRDERLRADTERRAAEIVRSMAAFYAPQKEVA